MKKTSLVAGILLCITIIGNAQKNKVASVDLQLHDSIDLAYAKSSFGFFDILGSYSPLLPFSNGIFMAREKLWFYQLDSSIQLKHFSLSEYDTALYLIVQKKVRQYLVRVKKQGEVWSRDIILTLDNSQHAVYPVGMKQFYLLKPGVINKVEYYEDKILKRSVIIKEPLVDIITIDTASFIACFIRKIVLYNDKQQPQTLFSSSIPILSTAINVAGMPIISTPAGIFAVLNNMTAKELITPATSGKLRISNDQLFVLVDKKQKIYHYKMLCR